MGHLRDARGLTLEAAKAMAAAAERFATERSWTIAVAVVDASGGLILFHCLEDTQPGSQDAAVLKARTAARYHRLALLSLPGVVALEGGVPIRVDGRVVGAIGVSGMSSVRDGEVAAAALAAFKP